MILKNSKEDVGYTDITEQAAAVKVSFRKESYFENVNYKAGCFAFFPFIWFVF